MNIEFYNSRVAVIIPKINKGILIPSIVDLYEGLPSKAIGSVKSYELNNDTFYSATLFIKDFDIFNRLIFRDYNFSELLKVEDQKKKCYFKTVHNTGVDSQCFVDDQVVVCSSWVSPFYAYNTRPGDSTYGGLFRHRISMEMFKDNFNLDNYIGVI